MPKTRFFIISPQEPIKRPITMRSQEGASRQVPEELLGGGGRFITGASFSPVGATDYPRV